MIVQLKKFRGAAGLTQAQIAKKVGVSQPNYQRWESGAAAVPEDKLAKLANAFDTSVEALLGRHAPLRTSLYDPSAPDELSYYGEVAIHFHGGGQPLLLSISEATFSQLHDDLQDNPDFVTVESLANQTVIFRLQAISDLYFSSEAYDDFGPEHGHYENRLSLLMPDPRDWQIVEALALDGIGIEDFAPEDVDRVMKQVMITDTQYDELVSAGHIAPENLAAEKARNQRETNQIFSAATDTTYQLSDGKQRGFLCDDPGDLYEHLWPLLAGFYDDMEEDLIRLPVAGRHRIAFVNLRAIDYITVPSHQLEQARIDNEVKEVDALASSRARKTSISAPPISARDMSVSFPTLARSATKS